MFEGKTSEGRKERFMKAEPTEEPAGQRDVRLESARETVVRQLREARKAKGMTQEHLAGLVGTKKSNISRLESGRYNPSLDFLVKVADGLGRQIKIKLE